MEWPRVSFMVVVGVAAMAVILPWVIPRGRGGLLFGVMAALAATGCWISYENHLHSMARPGDPLIRVDLLVIVPLVTLGWLSAVVSLAMARWRRRNRRQVPPGSEFPPQTLSRD